MAVNALLLLGAYLLGAVPAAYIAGRLAKGIDLRQHGSGNLGFTNAWRLLGPTWSIPVLLFDIAKGAGAVWLAYALAPETDWLAVACGVIAILGHTCTVFLGFRGGGKGVATSAGVFATLMPIAFLAAAVVFTALLVSLRIMSLASMTGALVLFIMAFGLFWWDVPGAPDAARVACAGVVAAVLLIKHRSNIHRILNGTEPRMRFSGKET